MKIILGGAMGRLCREIAAEAVSHGDQIVYGMDIAYTDQPMDFPMANSYDQIDCEADVLVDCSRPDGLSELLAFLKAKKMPAVICTTGFTESELAQIAEAAKEVPILRSGNMSLGINVLEHLVAMAARALGDGYDVEIIERHHRMKVDSPSGTALMLYEAVKKGTDAEKTPVHGRYGRNERRTSQEVGIHAVRGGTVTGEHEVGFYGMGEEIILTHRAENRSLFARGAVRAASFLKDKPAGMYNMSDVVAEILR
ncbi:MAG: 4-hydroxy-tetrahydrodipicolinate reductase [Clostridiales bacterium]|nr:4-hydroxy-tetrahydrodipicolinate reductase [Clostridiales bacterium]